MTRSSLDRTLRRAYLVLGFILFISIAAKLAPRVPGLEGTQLAKLAADVYDYLKDMSLVLVTVVAAYLANVFQKRSKFIERLEEEWRGIVRTKSALYTFCEKTDPAPDDYIAAFCRISEAIDNMRVVYANVGETDDLIGLYPYAPLHDMRRALQSIDPRKRPHVTADERKLVRDSVLQAFYALRETFLVEIDIAEPTTPLLPVATRRHKRPGATHRAEQLREKQKEIYRLHAAPRRPEIDELLVHLRAKEEPG